MRKNKIMTHWGGRSENRELLGECRVLGASVSKMDGFGTL